MPDFKIAVDAMGSDHAPAVEIEGAIEAAALFGIPIVLVGQEERIRSCLEKHDTSGLSLEIVHASEVITMDESAATAAQPASRSRTPCACTCTRRARNFAIRSERRRRSSRTRTQRSSVVAGSNRPMPVNTFGP